MSLRRALERLWNAGARRFYGKALAPNDNSKNQVYLGGSLKAVNLLPTREIVPDPEEPRRLKGALNFHWLSESGVGAVAPGAQLILYPDYPEARLSGFLRGCAAAPSELMSSRTPGRVLLMGVRSEDEAILAMLLEPGSEGAREFIARQSEFQVYGVLVELPAPEEGRDDGFASLATHLSRIAAKNWIRSWSLGANGECLACDAPQCGGYTLEAELGIRRNGRSEPDFLGWEVKSFDVPSLDRPSPGGKALTLMTPEPTGGLYQDDFAEFWKRHSYPDQSGRADREGRRNFGGIYRVDGVVHERTKLSLVLDGFDAKKKAFSATGALALVDKRGSHAASWSFPSLLEKWSRKHARAVYVPVQRRDEAPRSYRYSSRVSLGRGTDFVRLLDAIARGVIYLDPEIGRAHV